MELVQIRNLKDIDFYVKDIYAINLVPRIPVFSRTSRPTNGFNYIIEGEIEFTFNNESHRYTAGNLVYLPRGSAYVYRSISEHSRRVQLNFSILNAHSEDQIILSTTPVLIFQKLNYQMEQILFELCTASRSGRYAAGLQTRSLLMSFLYLLVHTEHSEYISSGRSNIAVNCIDDIKSNFSEPIGAEYFCEKYNISPTHLRRLFKEKTNRTITDYINRCRIDNALKMLVNTDLSVLDIALSVGFESENYFCRVFKKEVGQSPSQYRKANNLQ